MPQYLRLRNLKYDEIVEIKNIALSKYGPERLVQRATIIVAMLEDPTLTASEAGLRAGFQSPQVGPTWVRRFNAEGVAGLKDRERPGRMPIHGPEIKQALIKLALQRPSDLGYPYDLWPLKGLQQAFIERHRIRLSDSTIWTWLDEEGLCWKRQRQWPRLKA